MRTDWSELAKGIGWIVVAPALAYFLITHSWRVDSEAHELLLGFLSLIGGLIYFIPRY